MIYQESFVLIQRRFTQNILMSLFQQNNHKNKQEQPESESRRSGPETNRLLCETPAENFITAHHSLTGRAKLGLVLFLLTLSSYVFSLCSENLVFKIEIATVK